jgi:hypothetical protein
MTGLLLVLTTCGCGRGEWPTDSCCKTLRIVSCCWEICARAVRIMIFDCSYVDNPQSFDVCTIWDARGMSDVRLTENVGYDTIRFQAFKK